jgi:hypothetical protein
LSKPNIKKVGFGAAGDKNELLTKLDIKVVNTQYLSIKTKNLIGEKSMIGARAVVAMILKLRLGKGAQKSNWGFYPLKRK